MNSELKEGNVEGRTLERVDGMVSSEGLWVPKGNMRISNTQRKGH